MKIKDIKNTKLWIIPISLFIIMAGIIIISTIEHKFIFDFSMDNNTLEATKNIKEIIYYTKNNSINEIIEEDTFVRCCQTSGNYYSSSKGYECPCPYDKLQEVGRE